MLHLKTVEIPQVAQTMETKLYQGCPKKDQLVHLDREITEQSDELLKLKKQNRKLRVRFLPDPDSIMAKVAIVLAEIETM